MTVTVAVDGYWTRAKPLTLSSRAAKVPRRLRSRAPAKLYVYETLLERLSQDFEDMALELGPLIQEQDAVMRQGHLPRQGPLAVADHDPTSGIVW